MLDVHRAVVTADPEQGHHVSFAQSGERDVLPPEVVPLVDVAGHRDGVFGRGIGGAAQDDRDRLA